MNIQKFQSNTILTAQQLNNIVDGIDSLELLIPSISQEEIQREQERLQQLIDDAKNNIERVEREIAQYNYQTLVDGINTLNNFKQQAEQDLSDAKNKIQDHDNKFDTLTADLNQKIEEAKQKVEDNEALIAEANSKIEDAKTALDEAAKQLEDLAGSGEAGTSIQETLAKISAFATWYDENKEYINDYQSTVDMLNGIKEEIFTRMDTVDESITELGSKYDLQQGTIEEYGQSINTINGTITEVSNTISTHDGVITNLAQQINTTNDTVNTVKETIDAVNAQYEVVAGNVDTLSGKISEADLAIDGLDSRIEANTTAINTNTAAITSAQTVLSGIDASITSKVNSATDDKFSSIETRMSAAEGSIKTLSEYVDENLETNISEIVDTKLGEINTKIETIDTLSGRVTTVEEGLSANNTAITNAVNVVDTFEDRVTSVETELNGEEGKFSVLAGKVGDNETNIGTLNVSVNAIKSQVLSGSGTESDPYKISTQAINTEGITSSVLSSVSDDINKATTDASNALSIANNAASKADTASNAVTTQSSTIQQLSNQVAIVVAGGTSSDDGNTWTPKVESATIIAAIATTDENGNAVLNSNITISADHILLLGETVATNLNAMDLAVGGGSSKFNKDGSGYVANNVLAWNKQGDLALRGVSSNLTITVEDLISRLQSVNYRKDIDNYCVKYENVYFIRNSESFSNSTIYVNKIGPLVRLRIEIDETIVTTSNMIDRVCTEGQFILKGMYPSKQISSSEDSSFPLFKMTVKTDGTMVLSKPSSSSLTEGSHSYVFKLEWFVEDEVEIRKTVAETVSGTYEGHDYIDLGLPSGTMWSTVNYGASNINVPGDYLITWGATTKPSDYNGYPTNNNTQIINSTDIVYRNWNSKWFTPTGDQMKELIDNCTWSQITEDGVNYVRGVSKINGNMIKFPESTKDGSYVVRFAYWTKTRGEDIVNGTGSTPVTLKTAQVGYIRYGSTRHEVSYTSIAINRYAYVRPVFVQS